ncbi:type VI secretion system-associated protein [Thioalkalivibrio denitrificans]|uniref:Type VI secretion system-associated protein n=1 Tax=Thioalkalivibrio denitrificans TaxID=108003 RepID=A0A1V3NF42_9GAMM|nr:type VI secretion system contractile sheath small subunit [Thioalkalivibrio denitrificans]OOG23472.1 type VI secretion system-associated protein [Thioalkalivibrio denitrificans]
MAQSFQNEIPKARVNITLDVETGGASKKVDLPFKMLVVGDYSNGKGTGRIGERERINISGDNLESVMSELKPSVRYTVPDRIGNDGADLTVDLSFENLKSFSPEAVASRVPELANLIAMRNLLKDLKSNLLDNTRFRRELERIVQTQPELEGLSKELEAMVDSFAAAETDNGTGGEDR